MLYFVVILWLLYGGKISASWLLTVQSKVLRFSSGDLNHGGNFFINKKNYIEVFNESLI